MMELGLTACTCDQKMCVSDLKCCAAPQLFCSANHSGKSTLATSLTSSTGHIANAASLQGGSDRGLYEGVGGGRGWIGV